MMNTRFFGSNVNMRKWGAKVAAFAMAGTMMVTLVTGCGASGEKTASDSPGEETVENSVAQISGDLCIKDTWYDENDEVYMYIDYFYDDNGFVVEENHYVKLDGSDEFTWSKHYIEERDEAGNLIKDIYGDTVEGSDEIIGYYESTYDEHGNALTRKYWASESESYKEEYKYENTYDDNGNLISKKEFMIMEGVPEPIEMEEETYEYDENNNRIKTISVSFGNSTEYIYEDGKCIKEINYNSDGSVSSIIEYEFDDNGNKVRTNQFDGDGTTSTGYGIHEYAPAAK